MSSRSSRRPKGRRTSTSTSPPTTAASARPGMVRGSYHFARPAYPIAKTALAQAKFYVAHLGNVTTTKTLAARARPRGRRRPRPHCAHHLGAELPARRAQPHRPHADDLHLSRGSGRSRSATRRRSTAIRSGWRPTTAATPDAGATLWQYTAGAKVSGIKGLVDMSKLLADPTTFDALADGTVATPWPASAPGTPVAVKAAPGVGSATVSWLPPDAGTAGITGYTVTIAPADASAPAQTVSIGPIDGQATFTGLTNGAAYTFTVQARNARRPGAVAAPTTTVVPQNPTALAVSGAVRLCRTAQPPTVHGRAHPRRHPRRRSRRCRSPCRPASSARRPGSGSRRRRPTRAGAVTPDRDREPQPRGAAQLRRRRRHAAGVRREDDLGAPTAVAERHPRRSSTVAAPRRSRRAGQPAALR